MQEYSVYILYSRTSDKYYVGQTRDVEKRIQQHNDPENTSFTSKSSPWVLVRSFKTGTDRGVALKVEKFIKRQKSRVFIKKIIADPFQFDFIAKLVGVPSTRD